MSEDINVLNLLDQKVQKAFFFRVIFMTVKGCGV